MKAEEEEKGAVGYSKLPNALVDSGLLALLKGSEMKTYAAILRHAQYASRQAFPSLACLCKETGLQRVTVQGAIKKLVFVGLIRKHKFYQGRKFKNVFTVQDVPEIILPYQPINSASREPRMQPKNSASRGAQRDEKTGKYAVKPKNLTYPYQPEKLTCSTSRKTRLVNRLKETEIDSDQKDDAPPAPSRGSGSALRRPEPKPASTDLLRHMAQELGKEKTLAYLRRYRPSQAIPEFLLDEESREAFAVSQVADQQPVTSEGGGTS